ncbi:MAG: sigma-54-dependent Fis family transcriptional regulator [Deltaproteobacteria bacterium]|nr:sigma-54-dependent Fis family transcriptional regulator [Deltaproteobacteria bacterium]MBW2122125.1 sigma-54-dependent Fis family transcriptional regulator [Deltaproteobacteria bacterium]
MKPAILIVDDDEVMRQTLSDVFTKREYEVYTTETGKEAITSVQTQIVDLVLLDIRLPDMDGISVLKKIKEIDTDLMVIMMTAYSDVQTAVMAMKAGAYDYINKPFELDELKLLIQKAIETQSLRNEVRRLRRQHEKEESHTQIYGNSPQVRNIKELIQMIAQTPRTSVLIQGESGTGKELAANAIHYGSKRANKPLIKINCSAIPENLLETELFGYEKGAFTDAKSTKKGLLELASGGTVFLDEIGDMNPYLQSKFLRVLETQSFMRVGGSREIHVDLRFIAASNKNLAEMVNRGDFRKDLYYRLKVMVLDIPPLRERKEDILLLANLFIEEGNKELGKNIKGILPKARDLLLNYSWPGNIRELKNVLERAMILSTSDEISPETLPIELREHRSAPPGLSLDADESSLEAVEKKHIFEILSMVNGNKSKAARSLGISRSTLREKLKKYAMS